MIDKIVLSNFKSHAHTEVSLDSLTTISGDTNHGKSNIFRALKIVLHNNPWPSKWLRWGTKSGYIELHLKDGHIIRRTRTLETQSVKITYPDGKTITFEGKVDAQSEIEAVTGISKVTIDDSRGPEDLNFVGINNPFYLIGLRPDIVLRRVTSIIGATRLEQAKTKIAKQIVREKDSLKKLKTECQAQEQEAVIQEAKSARVEGFMSSYNEHIRIVNLCENTIIAIDSVVDLFLEDLYEEYEKVKQNLKLLNKTLDQTLFLDKCKQIYLNLEQAKKRLDLLSNTLVEVITIKENQQSSGLCPTCGKPYNAIIYDP